jgi:uncharacterized protein YaaW (UPF0174 family)
MTRLILNQADSLAREESHRQLDLGVQVLRWTRNQHVAAVVVAKLEYLRRNFGAAAVTFAKIVIHNDSHRIAPAFRRALISQGLGRGLTVQVSRSQTIDTPIATPQRAAFA